MIYNGASGGIVVDKDGNVHGLIVSNIQLGTDKTVGNIGVAMALPLPVIMPFVNACKKLSSSTPEEAEQALCSNDAIKLVSASLSKNSRTLSLWECRQIINEEQPKARL